MKTSTAKALFVLLGATWALGCSSGTTASGGSGAAGGIGGGTGAVGGDGSAAGGTTGPGSGGIPAGGATAGGATAGGATAGGATAGGATAGGATAGGGSNGSGGSASGGASPSGAGGTSGSAGQPGAGGDGAGGAQTAPTCPPTATLTPGDSTGTLQVGAFSRSYLLHVPASYTGTSVVPLVVDLHPFLNFLPTDAAASQEQGSGYLQLSDSEGFIVVYPEGIDRAWNLAKAGQPGVCCTQSHDVDDVGFMEALVKKLEADACIDSKRVYATGYSNGGGLAHLLACRDAGIFAAVAPASFDLITETAPCTPSRPITVISFRGLNDSVVPYAGGNPPAPPSSYPLTPVHFLGAQGTFDEWSTLDGCTDTAAPSTGNADWDCKAHSACKDGVEVTLCSGHTANKSDGHVEGDAALGWAMLERHALP